MELADIECLKDVLTFFRLFMTRSVSYLQVFVAVLILFARIFELSFFKFCADKN